MSEASYVCFWSKSYREIFLNIFLLSRIINPSRFNLFVDSNLRDLISGHWQDDCMFLLCHVRVSGWIHNLYLPECQGTSCTSLAKWLSVRLRTKWLWVQVPLESLDTDMSIVHTKTDNLYVAILKDIQKVW